MSELNTIKGSCLCGAVKLLATNVNRHIDACHCNMCRKWSGGAFLGVECNDGIDFEGTENIALYQSSEWAERGFCNNCGSHLFYRLKENNHYFVPVGIFNDDEDFEFSLQVFIDEKPSYYAFANDTKKMTGEEVFAMFNSSSDQTKAE